MTTTQKANTTTAATTTTKPVWKLLLSNDFCWAEYLGTGERDEVVEAAEADMEHFAAEELRMGEDLHGEEQDERDYKYTADEVEKVDDLRDLTEYDIQALATADPVVFRDSGGNA